MTYYVRVDPHAIKANAEGRNEPVCVIDTDHAPDVLRCYEVEFDGPTTLRLFKPMERSALQSHNVCIVAKGAIRILIRNEPGHELWKDLEELPNGR